MFTLRFVFGESEFWFGEMENENEWTGAKCLNSECLNELRDTLKWESLQLSR